jgi:uridine phosphorylase
MTAISTGIGTDNVEIVWQRSWPSRSTRPSFASARAACCATTSAWRPGDQQWRGALEATTKYFVHEGYPAVADYVAVAALVEAANQLGHRAHVGITATAPGFYGAQGRPIPQLPIRFPTSPTRWPARV